MRRMAKVPRSAVRKELQRALRAAKWAFFGLSEHGEPRALHAICQGEGEGAIAEEEGLSLLA